MSIHSLSLLDSIEEVQHKILLCQNDHLSGREVTSDKIRELMGRISILEGTCNFSGVNNPSLLHRVSMLKNSVRILELYEQLLRREIPSTARREVASGLHVPKDAARPALGPTTAEDSPMHLPLPRSSRSKRLSPPPERVVSPSTHRALPKYHQPIPSSTPIPTSAFAAPASRPVPSAKPYFLEGLKARPFTRASNPAPASTLRHSSPSRSSPASSSTTSVLAPATTLSPVLEANLWHEGHSPFKFLKNEDLTKATANTVLEPHVEGIDGYLRNKFGGEEIFRLRGHGAGISTQAFLASLELQPSLINQRLMKLLQEMQALNSVYVRDDKLVHMSDGQLGVRLLFEDNDPRAPTACTAYSRKIQEKILRLEIGEDLIIQGGVPRHEMIYRVKKTTSRTYEFTIYNASKAMGVMKYHKSQKFLRLSGDNIRTCMHWQKRDIPADAMVNFVPKLIAMYTATGNSRLIDQIYPSDRTGMARVLKKNPCLPKPDSEPHTAAFNELSKKEALERIDWIYETANSLSSTPISYPTEDLEYVRYQTPGNCAYRGKDVLHHHEHLLEARRQGSGLPTREKNRLLVEADANYQLARFKCHMNFLIESFNRQNLLKPRQEEDLKFLGWGLTEMLSRFKKAAPLMSSLHRHYYRDYLFVEMAHRLDNNKMQWSPLRFLA